MSIDDIIEEVEEKMMEALDAMERDFSGFRTGKASPALVETLMIDYYGTSVRLRDISGISTPEPRLIVIQPWDQNALKPIEKAIIASSLGISPINDGRVIRLPIPELTEERRRDLTREVKRRAEEARVEVRNHRRNGNEASKKAKNKNEITEDMLHDFLDRCQKLTDEYIEKINELAAAKEAEIMQV